MVHPVSLAHGSISWHREKTSVSLRRDLGPTTQENIFFSTGEVILPASCFCSPVTIYPDMKHQSKSFPLLALAFSCTPLHSPVSGGVFVDWESGKNWLWNRPSSRQPISKQTNDLISSCISALVAAFPPESSSPRKRTQIHFTYTRTDTHAYGGGQRDQTWKTWARTERGCACKSSLLVNLVKLWFVFMDGVCKQKHLQCCPLPSLPNTCTSLISLQTEWQLLCYKENVS